jgi:hypothetical protein
LDWEALVKAAKAARAAAARGAEVEEGWETAQEEETATADQGWAGSATAGERDCRGGI